MRCFTTEAKQGEHCEVCEPNLKSVWNSWAPSHVATADTFGMVALMPMICRPSCAASGLASGSGLTAANLSLVSSSSSK